MTPPAPSASPRRPAFRSATEEPPFWRSPEFVRFAALALIALGGAAAFLYTQRAQGNLDAERGNGTAAEVASAANAANAASTAGAAPVALSAEERAARDAYLSTAFEGALRDQDEGAEFQDSTGYRKLLEQVEKFDPANFTTRVKHQFEPAAALADPDAWRGEFVRTAGILGDIEPMRLARPVSGRKDAWRAQLGSGEEFGDRIILEFLDRPFPELSLKDLYWRPIEIEGVFYRHGTYVSDVVNSKRQTLEVTWTLPWIFVRNVRLLDESVTPTRTFLNEHPMWILAVLAFVIFGGRLLISWVQSRRRGKRRPAAPSSIRVMFEQKLREKGLPPAPPSPPKP